ncbi:branched-chain amino acid ABC transporter permease [Acrocarpospora phusangensis]|uniref:Branched-chain amino acid ABC transporter permease n=1 Tax=Acrocarpospora phusangensis TaxID=1070424 RepID=A0A919QAX0_9ACTN|nr:branched-chain amino acid ABC transporter permease [Acrocarpospora phusangensis]GIH24369.1 branched-chain amino acid ABC transporter permease [Acrocarpospora phusangensis]
MIAAIVQGVLVGGTYALVACGLSLAFGVMRLVNIAHGDLAVCGAYLALMAAAGFGAPPVLALVLVLPLAFGVGALLQLTLFERALRGGELAPVLVTFGLSVVIQNLLVTGASANPRSLDGGAFALAGFEVGGLTLSWLRTAGFATAVVVLGSLHLLLARTGFGRRVRATADDPEAARLSGVRVRPVFACVAGISVATAALAGMFLGLMSTFDPYSGGLILIFAFEAVVIGGLGSLWGTLAGGIVLGVTQQLVALWDVRFAVLAVHVLFFGVLVVRPVRA